MLRVVVAAEMQGSQGNGGAGSPEMPSDAAVAGRCLYRPSRVVVHRGGARRARDPVSRSSFGPSVPLLPACVVVLR